MAVGIAGIGQHRQPGEIGDDLAQNLEPFAAEIALLVRQAGDVAARPRQGRDQAIADRVRRERKDEWE